jgi:hypothetical protein
LEVVAPAAAAVSDAGAAWATPAISASVNALSRCCVMYLSFYRW